MSDKTEIPERINAIRDHLGFLTQAIARREDEIEHWQNQFTRVLGKHADPLSAGAVAKQYADVLAERDALREARAGELRYIEGVLQDITKQNGEAARESAQDTLAWVRNRRKADVMAERRHAVPTDPQRVKP